MYQVNYQEPIRSTPANLAFHNSALPNFIAELGKFAGFDSEVSFNAYCNGIISAWREAFPQPIGQIDQFNNIIAMIESNEPGPAGLAPIRTSWGGVHITEHTPPHVEKFLAVKAGGYLAFETHAEKIETLSVHEGCGFLLYRPKDSKELRAEILSPGFEITLHPGQEHCIIGTENLLVFECSEDFKGMDQDLIFIYLPK